MTEAFKNADANGQGNPNPEVIKELQDKIYPLIGKFSLTAPVVNVTTGGDEGVEFDIPIGAEIIGATVICTRANSGGTMQIKTGATSPVAITDAIVCAVDKARAEASEIDDATNIVGVDGVKVFADDPATAGRV